MNTARSYVTIVTTPPARRHAAAALETIAAPASATTRDNPTKPMRIMTCPPALLQTGFLAQLVRTRSRDQDTSTGKLRIDAPPRQLTTLSAQRGFAAGTRSKATAMPLFRRGIRGAANSDGVTKREIQNGRRLVGRILQDAVDRARSAHRRRHGLVLDALAAERQCPQEHDRPRHRQVAGE